MLTNPLNRYCIIAFAGWATLFALLGAVFGDLGFLGLPVHAADVVLLAPPDMPKSPKLSQPAMPPPPAFETDPMVEGKQFVTLPEGTALGIWLMTLVDSRSSMAGDAIEGLIAQPLYIGRFQVIPPESRLRGTITKVLQPIEGRNAIIQVNFTQLLLPDGQVFPLQSHVQSADGHEYWGGTLTPGTERTVVQHGVLGIGYYNQEVLAGKRAMGGHIAQDVGSQHFIILDSPIRVAVEAPALPKGLFSNQW